MREDCRQLRAHGHTECDIGWWETLTHKMSIIHVTKRERAQRSSVLVDPQNECASGWSRLKFSCLEFPELISPHKFIAVSLLKMCAYEAGESTCCPWGGPGFLAQHLDGSSLLRELQFQWILLNSTGIAYIRCTDVHADIHTHKINNFFLKKVHTRYVIMVLYSTSRKDCK